MDGSNIEKKNDWPCWRFINLCLELQNIAAAHMLKKWVATIPAKLE